MKNEIIIRKHHKKYTMVWTFLIYNTLLTIATWPFLFWSQDLKAQILSFLMFFLMLSASFTTLFWVLDLRSSPENYTDIKLKGEEVKLR